jgi:hypothetical protein
MTPLCLKKISTEITFHCYLVWLLSLFLFKSFSGSDTHPRFKLFACKSNTYTRALHINSINPFIQVIITITTTTTTSRTSLLVCRLLISSWHSRTKVKMAAPHATLHLIDCKVNVLFINEIVGHFCSYWGVFCGGGDGFFVQVYAIRTQPRPNLISTHPPTTLYYTVSSTPTLLRSSFVFLNGWMEFRRGMVQNRVSREFYF